MNQILVMLADDHELVRIGMRRILADVAHIKVVGEAASGEELINQAVKVHPDVILMDVKMPGIGGLEATKKILRTLPKVKVIVVTVYGDGPFPIKFLQAGAMGYITKGASLDEMVKAIEMVYEGKRYLSPEIAQQMALRQLEELDSHSLDCLSERELQVMVMIVNGKKVSEISDMLHVSPKTINSYRYRLFSKLRLHSDVELTHFAIRHGMLDAEDVATG